MSGVSLLLRWLLLLLAMAAPGAARAHTRSETHSAWQISGTTVHLQFTVPDLEAERLTADGSMPSIDTLGRYLAEHVGAASRSGACVLSKGPQPVAASPGYRRYELAFACADPDIVAVTSTAFFELVESHTNFAQIQDSQGRFVEQLITKDRPSINVKESAGGGPLESAGFVDFLRMGMMHIFTGIDHMSFMLGLVLISRRVRDLLFVITGFTLGHSVTLGLAVTGVLRPEAQYIDALVALTIAVIGAETVGDTTHRPGGVAATLGLGLALTAMAKWLGAPITLPLSVLAGSALFTASYLMWTGTLRDAGRVRLLMTLMFGLIHGFGFASDLLQMRLPQGRLAELLLGFNLGVEIAQVTVVLAALALAWLLVRLRIGLPRPILTDVCAAFLVGEGLCWFVTRIVTTA